jgi:hypothetical protein
VHQLIDSDAEYLTRRRGHLIPLPIINNRYNPRSPHANSRKGFTLQQIALQAAIDLPMFLVDERGTMDVVVITLRVDWDKVYIFTAPQNADLPMIFSDDLKRRTLGNLGSLNI